MKSILLNTILGRVATKSDGSLSLSFSTSEMDAAETTVLLKLTRINLKMLLTPIGVAAEAPVEVKSEISNKSHSARLRNCLFVLYKQQQAKGFMKDKTFEEMYAANLERIINDVKNQLEPVSELWRARNKNMPILAELRWLYG